MKTQTCREDSHLKMAVGIEVMLTQTKECLGYQSWDRQGRLLPWSLQKKTASCNTFHWVSCFQS